MARLRCLDYHGLTHHRAPIGQNLEIGHCAAAWGDLTGGGREGTKGGGRGFVKERAHCAPLFKKSLHGYK